MIAISVDLMRCDGHGQCELVAPDLFTLDDDGYSSVGLARPVADARKADAERGVDACPAQALSLDRPASTISTGGV